MGRRSLRVEGRGRPRQVEVSGIKESRDNGIRGFGENDAECWTMKPFLSLLRDWWGQWAVDRAGVESGRHHAGEIRAMLERGEIRPNTWLRHVWTRKFSLVGEALYANDLATDAEFEAWFPEPRIATSLRATA